MSNFFQEIRERRVLPSLGVYIGACWVLVEILDRLVERYLLSPYLTDIAFWGLYSLIPAVILIAWTHGKPGKDEITRAEKVGIPINLIATLGLLITVFGGKDLGAAAEKAVVINELGQEEAHYVPKESYRRRVAVFFWENKSDDENLDWLQYGVTELLSQDLRQNPFMVITTPWSGWGNGYIVPMRQAGFDDGLNVPVSLMNEIANDARRQYFISGSIDTIDTTSSQPEYELIARVWEVGTLRKVGEVTRQGWDILDLVDEMSVDIRSVLEVPDGKGKSVADLDLSQGYGESMKAFEHYVEGNNQHLFNNDLAAAAVLYDKALEEDPKFVNAWYVKGVNLLQQGNVPGSQAALAEAQKLDYRLPERDRVRLKTLQYQFSGEPEKMSALLRMQVRLKDDAESHRRLANHLKFSGDLDGAKEEFLAALERDSLDLAAYQELSVLERASGDLEKAIEYAQEFHQRKPDDLQGIMNLGDLYLNSGDLDQARQYFTDAQLLEEYSGTATLRLAQVAMREGEWDTVNSLVDKAFEAATSPQEKSAAVQTRNLLFARLGKMRDAVEGVKQQSALDKQYMPPLSWVFGTYFQLVAYYTAIHDVESAEAAQAEARQFLTPPLDDFLLFNDALIDLYQDDFDAALASMDRLEQTMRQLRAEYLMFQVYVLRGRIAYEMEEYSAAVEHFQGAVDSIEKSVLTGGIQAALPIFYSGLAAAHTDAGNHDLSRQALDIGMKLDAYEPALWLEKARLQMATGQHALALASIGYALAIWKDADPDYSEYNRALKIKAELEALAAL